MIQKNLAGGAGSFTRDLTLSGATLRAVDCDNAACDDIYLGNVNSLTFVGSNALEAGTSSLRIDGNVELPSGFKISGPVPTTTGTVTYASVVY